MVKKINNNDITEAMQGVAVVDFSATWCGPCQMLAPIMEELSEDLAGKATIFSADVDQNPELARQFRIINIPAVVILKDGEQVDFQVGFQPKQAMLSAIEKYL